MMISEVARTTGLGIRRKSIRISFDTFMAKSRPGLQTGEEEVQVSCDWWRAGHVTQSSPLIGCQGQGEKENISLEQLTERRKEKQFGNVRRRSVNCTIFGVCLFRFFCPMCFYRIL